MTVGVGGPPVTIVPDPVRLIVAPVPEVLPDPVRLGKFPLAF